MKKIVLLSLLFISAATWGQTNVDFIKKNFKEDVKGYKKAMDSLKTGDNFYNQGKYMYHFALPYYLSAENFNPNNAMLNYKIGQCFLNSSFKTLCLSYFQKAYQLNPAVAPDIHYCLGRGYHLDMDWDKAIQEYNAYMQGLDMKKDADALADTKKKIEECNNGKDLVLHPIRVFLDNLGKAINGQYPEYGPLISADESEMIFTSRRANGTGGNEIDASSGGYYEDLYISYFKNGEWTPAKDMGPPINTPDHDATAGLSNDGQTLYIYRYGKKDGGDIWQSHLDGAAWSKPKRLTSKINSDFHESSVTISPDNKTIYFVSDRPGGYGDKDIYKTTLNEKDKWGDAVNLGPTINTQYGEEGIDMLPDGKTLYFSSQGHKTMGGYDIFKSVCENGQWSEPENIGYPVNTPDDDVFFVLNASGKHGYFASVRKGGYGDKDLYMVTFLGPEKPVALSSEDNLLAGSTASVSDMMAQTVTVHTTKTTLLKGIIYDSATHAPLLASIELVDNVKNQIIASFTSNSTTGRYLVTLPSGYNYGIAVKAPNYLFYSANFNLPDTASYQVVEKNIPLQSIAIGSRIVLRNIFFDFDKATLRPESTAELDRLIGLLNQYPKLKIEISGYTDNKGSQAYNQTLSQSRAKSVVDYLVAHGIAADRLTFKGYGMENPIASNDTDEGRQLNRRTEFKITGN